MNICVDPNGWAARFERWLDVGCPCCNMVRALVVGVTIGVAGSLAMQLIAFWSLT